MYWTYLRRELRRRSKQAIVVALGLGLGIGLVMTVSAATAGVKTAQASVLHSLYGIGTDITVSKTAAAGTAGPLHFGGFGSPSSTSRPAAGTKISRNTLRPTPGEATLSAADVTGIRGMHEVDAAAGGLVLTDTSFSGTIPSFSPGSFAGGSTAGGSASRSGPSFDISSFTVDGVQSDEPGVGPLGPATITSGTYFTTSQSDADVAVVTSSYAKTDKLAVGSELDVAGSTVKVIGIADEPSGAAEVYLPLATAQKLAGLSGKVTDVFVSADKSSAVSSLAAAIDKAVPGATVTTSASLAKEVTGSLSSASSLATDLGKWLSIAALAAAFIVAGLLMMSAVSRRVREFGTLKAIGWRSRRIIGQVMGEGLAIGILGGIAGIVIGIAATEVVSAVAPSLSATVGTALATGGGFGGFGGGFSAGSGFGRSSPGFAAGHGFRPFDTSHTVLVHLTAPLQADTIGIAVALAIGGGLVAGAFGAWRAAHLRPADALRRIE